MTTLRAFLVEQGIDPDALLDYDWPMLPTGRTPTEFIGGDAHPQGLRLVADSDADGFGIVLHGPVR